MGNRNANQQNEEHNENNEEILIQNDINNPLAKIDAPLVKKIFAVRNPFSIKKTSLVLEKDAGPGNFFYIKFEYDSLTNFNCYINFDVSKNPSKQILSKNLADNNNYIPAYIPSEKFESKKILVKNLPKGVNMEFFEKEAGIDIDYFKSNKSPNIEGKSSTGTIIHIIWENKNKLMVYSGNVGNTKACLVSPAYVIKLSQDQETPESKNKKLKLKYKKNIKNNILKKMD